MKIANKDNSSWIPDVDVKKIAGNFTEFSAWFTWRGKEQWHKLSTDNDYGDGYWLIVDTNYTEDFQDYLDEELDEYDSLETMFTSLLPDQNFEIVYE